jgi:hypothetical protein
MVSSNSQPYVIRHAAPARPAPAMARLFQRMMLLNTVPASR